MTREQMNLPYEQGWTAIAHDLRTPLAALSIAVEFALEAGHEPQRSEQLLEIIHRNLLWMQELVEGARDAQSARSLEPKPVDLRELVHEVGALFEALLQSRQQHLEIDHSADCFILTADRGWLLRVLVNLLDNASKYGPPGDRLRVVLRRRPGVVVIQVCDHGPGIPVGERDAVFRPFYRTRSAQVVPGAGLGLATVRALIRDHGGEVYVDRRGGETRVNVSLPYGDRPEYSDQAAD